MAQALKIAAVPDTAADPVAAARAAGLRHVDDTRPGIRRQATGKKVRQGKRFVPQFVYLDAQGRRLHDADAEERIRKLVIPPAWTDVWICPDPNGHIQATGRDARGRKQYRYHPRWREERDGTKYSRMIAFGQSLPQLRRRIAADLRLPGLPRRKVLATVVRLLETTFMRVGNEEYARTNKSFGLTTLKDRHVDIRPSEVRFHFRGKSGVMHDVAVHDRAVARIVRKCRDLPGQELFQYLDEDGKPATIDSADVNEYIREATGHDFTAKDFRTWAGTVLAALALQEVDAAAELLAGRGRKARPRKPGPRDVARAIERVAQRLGNTPAVCRKCYVHPDVIASYLHGTLSESLARRVDVPLASRRPGALRPDEAAVLALLQRRMAEDKRGDRLETQLRRSLRQARQTQRQGSRGQRWRSTA
ncbi:MAG TPA: DNA topoisomerase IB [Polyangia bacterium]|nr:DNA topoisomerase IB [Polyangia bacterium]